jgi:hypothetical protein
MSTRDETVEALFGLVLGLAKASADSAGKSVAASESYASAARQLAEAAAWLRSPGQSHGGSSSVEVKK